MKELVAVFRTERAGGAKAQVGRRDDASIAHKTNAQAVPIVLEVRRANDDVAGLNNLVGLKRIRHEAVQLLGRLNHDAPVTQRQHGPFLHAGVLDLFLTERGKPWAAIPMAWDTPQPRQARLLVFRVRLEAGDHLGHSSIAWRRHWVTQPRWGRDRR